MNGIRTALVFNNSILFPVSSDPGILRWLRIDWERGQLVGTSLPLFPDSFCEAIGFVVVMILVIVILDIRRWEARGIGVSET